MYAQTDFNQMMGINPVYKISQIGCLLTAFCNLMSRYGEDVSPASLNGYFVQNNVYIPSPEDGSDVSDDLSWQSINSYDSLIRVTAVGSGNPSTNNAIVKFEYKSYQTGNPTTHFCLVDSYAAGTIIDSWDGKVKSWNVYGGPKSWASYERITPPQGDNNVTLTLDNVTQLYQDILGRAPDTGGAANYTGKTLDFTLKDMLNSQEYKSKISAEFAGQINELQNTVATLNAQLSAVQPPVTSATPQQIVGGKLVDVLKEALNG